MELNPYAASLGARDPAKVMAETPERWARVVPGLSAEQMEARPAPGKWNMRELLAHVADCEIAFGFRLRQAYGGEKMVQPFDQDAWARAYRAYSAEAALRVFTVLRAWNVAFVKGLSEADKRLLVVHPERGEMVLWTIVETMAGHDLHHLDKFGA